VNKLGKDAGNCAVAVPHNIEAEVTRLRGVMRRMPDKTSDRYYQIQLLKDALKNYAEADNREQKARLADTIKRQTELIERSSTDM
jgi:hypothetical protein